MGDNERKLIRDFYQKLAAPERSAIKKLLAMDRDRRKIQIASYIATGLFQDMGEDLLNSILELEKMTDKEIVEMLAEKVREEIERGFWASIGLLLSKLKWW
jgi:hypothetical protein